MKTIFNAVARELFGPGCRQAGRSLFVCLALFFGLRASGVRVAAAPSVLWLTAGVFTAGAMRQALCSRRSAAIAQGLLILPFSKRAFAAGYPAALAAYTLLTNTAPQLAKHYAVTDRQPADPLPGLLCALHAALLTAAHFPCRRARPLCLLWGAAALAAPLFPGCGSWLPAFLLADSLPALAVLLQADGCAFCPPERQPRQRARVRRHSLLLYLCRYLADHKNYLVNTAALWGVACLLPALFSPAEDLFLAPMGFAILSLNTPLGILLSCDPALEQAVRSLPGQKRTFCLPYGEFLFCSHLAAEAVFLFSWQAQNGAVTGSMLLAAVLFAMQSAILTVLLEWGFPLRGWKLEADLWHHPRKYAVPLVLLAAAALLGAQPALLPLLGLLQAAGLAVLLCIALRAR